MNCFQFLSPPNRADEILVGDISDIKLHFTCYILREKKRRMGGSESRFNISPYTGKVRQESFWHAPINLENGEPLTTTQYFESSDRLAKLLFKRDGKYVNIRFDQHPQPYVAVGSDKQSVVYKKSHDEDCQWVVLVIGIREHGTKRWNPLDRSLQLNWENAAGKDFLTIYISRRRKVIVHSGQGLRVVNLPRLDQHPTNEDALIELISHSMFVQHAVDHNWSFEEVTRGFIGGFAGVGGGATGYILIPVWTVISLDFIVPNSCPAHARYPLETLEHSILSTDTLSHIALVLQQFVAEL